MKATSKFGEEMTKAQVLESFRKLLKDMGKYEEYITFIEGSSFHRRHTSRNGHFPVSLLLDLGISVYTQNYSEIFAFNVWLESEQIVGIRDTRLCELPND